MFEVRPLEGQIIQISQIGSFTAYEWQDYQQLVLGLLEQSNTLLYVLGDFRKATIYEPTIMSEIKLGAYLKHPRLGLLVLLGGTTLTNFALSLTEAQALKEKQSDKLRVHRDYDRAMETLRYFRDMYRTPLGADGSIAV